MDGPALMMAGVQVLPRALAQFDPSLLEGGANEYAAVITHQPSGTALALLRKVLGCPREHMVRVLETLGNTVAASLPCALYEAVKSGRVGSGDRVLLLGMGAGLAMGAMSIVL